MIPFQKHSLLFTFINWYLKMTAIQNAVIVSLTNNGSVCI